MKRYLSHSTEETEQIAAEFASTLKSGDVIAYKGPMGAGKTAFTRGPVSYTHLYFLTFERIGQRRYLNVGYRIHSNPPLE